MLLWQALAIVFTIALVSGSFASAAATAALLANWGVCTLLESQAGNPWEGYPFPYMSFAAVDLVAAVLILMLPLSKWQSILSATYVAGLGAHAWYAWNGIDVDDTKRAYYYATHYMAWSQMWIAAAWTGVSIVGYYLSDSYPWSELMARRRMRSAVPVGMEAGQ